MKVGDYIIITCIKYGTCSKNIGDIGRVTVLYDDRFI